MTTTPAEKPGQQDAPRAQHEIQRFQSEDLFRGARLILITHAGTEYRLIKTRNDKLMLQK